MKTLPTRSTIVLILSLTAMGVIALVAYGQGPATPRPTPTTSDNDSIHLVMGSQTTEPLHVTEASLKAALATLDALDPAHPGKAYRVQYWEGHHQKWEKGNKNVEDLFPGKVALAHPSGDVRVGEMSGSHSTQFAIFTSTATNDHGLRDLQKFVSTLQPTEGATGTDH